MRNWYRKKPVVVQVELWTGQNEASIREFTGQKCPVEVGVSGTAYMTIETLEGPILATPGDYIIRGVKGEFYPCKPDIFEETYELASGAPTPPTSKVKL